MEKKVCVYLRIYHFQHSLFLYVDPGFIWCHFLLPEKLIFFLISTVFGHFLKKFIHSFFFF